MHPRTARALRTGPLLLLSSRSPSDRTVCPAAVCLIMAAQLGAPPPENPERYHHSRPVTKKSCPCRANGTHCRHRPLRRRAQQRIPGNSIG
ncbi:hypothetical protein BVI2075_420024 [Burkholderia vietnamiensis]|nr:hypothetical protein BVI2075_420024 [Burkholderia vietnamiensis]